MPGYQRPRRGRPLAWGLGVSIVVHLLILLFAARTWLPVRKPAAAGTSGRQAARTLPEMQALRIRITSEATPSEPTSAPPEPVERERVPPRRTPATEMPREQAPAPTRAGERGGQAERGDTRTPAERIRPEYVDPRLWERPGAPAEPEKSDFDRARERVYARIEALNDSLAAEGEAARRATDWTITDKDGKKWGISPDGVHLGGVRLPIPIRASGPPDKAKEARDRAGKAAEIDRQADGARIRGTINDQIKATREQKDRERTQARRDTTKAGGTE